ncbi:unnamed protein product [Ambrosiozyma monospora]|uniref:Unnamed protein product n=1 Tax=Ambrosiozyma monospora TaxID=43982 RepID=A0ACB5T379_AMBMO|nr:unnamed protein product [Ambrosiozyma monospora]
MSDQQQQQQQQEEDTRYTYLTTAVRVLYQWLPEIPSKQKGDQRKALRRKLTTRYGYITFIITILFVLLIPYFNIITRKLFFGIYSRIVRRIKVSRFRNNFFLLNLPIIKTIMFWSLVLGLLSLLQTYHDAQFIAARVGRVATYCLPSILFLTLRPSPLPHTLYLSLIPIHKWLSRIVVLQSLLHTLLFIALFLKRNTVKKIWKTDNLYGIVAMLAFTAIFVTSLPTIRRACYNIFFINHYIFTWVAVITLYFHVRPGIPYLTALNCFLLFLQMGYRFWITKSTTIEATQVSSNMVIVSIPNESIAHKSGLPGCHIRMIEFDERNYFKQLWKNVMVPIQHPFTVATLPIDSTQKLIVRKGNFKLDSNKKYLITGLFLPHLHFMKPLPSPNPNPKSLLFNTKVKKCLIVVGGSAISFALPILRTLSYNGAMVKIIWVIRDHEDLKVLDDFKNTLVNDDCIDIFITGGYSEDEKLNFKTAVEELHRRKRVLELTDAERILGDDYDYKKYSTSSPTTVSGGKSPLSPNSGVGGGYRDYGAVYEDGNENENEIDMNVHFDPELELGIPRLNLNSRNSKMWIWN